MEPSDSSPPAVNESGDRLSFVVCRTGQGTELHGTLHRLTRFAAVFEVYNPYSILQLSEVLSDFRIFMNDRVVYSSRAVIANLVNTGIVVVCEASLNEEGWIDIDLFSPVHKRDNLLEEFQDFIRETERIYSVLPDFKVAVADMQVFLSNLRRWMEQVELGLRSLPAIERLDAEREVLEKLEGPIVPMILPVMRKFEAVAETIPKELQPAHRSYIKRQLHPIVLCAPFVYRTFQKPLGYAGDYEMVSMMLRSPYEGSSIFAKLINKLYLEIPPVIAHRNRIHYLRQALVAESNRAATEGRVAKIFNLGCGPAQEVSEFLAHEAVSDNADFLLLDFNDETLAFTTRTLEDERTRHRRRTGLRLEKRSVQQVIREASKRSADPEEQYDVVYCAGLFDYLSDRVCRRLLEIFYGLLAPGGLLMATNVHPSNPWKNWMEYLAEWHLVYRTEEQFIKLAPEAAPPDSVLVKADQTGVNIFLEVRKPHA